MYHAFNALASNELHIYGVLKRVDLVAGGAYRCLLNSCVPSNNWYAESCRWTRDVLRILRESWAWLMRQDHRMVGNFLSPILITEIKWFLKVWIYLSARLTRWLCGLADCIWMLSY